MADAPCTNPDCDHTVKDGYLCWPDTNLTHSLLRGIAYANRHRGIGTVLQPDDRDAIRDGIDGTNYRLDVLHEPPGAGPGLLEDLDVTIARIDAIPYRPNPLPRVCREVGCARPAETPDGYCGGCGDYLTPEAKRDALVSPATRARDQLLGVLTYWARRLSYESGVHQAHAAARSAVEAAMVAAGEAATRQADLRRAEMEHEDDDTLKTLRDALAEARTRHEEAHARQTAAVQHANRLTAPPMPHTISWLAGSVRAIRGREWAGEMLTQLQAAVDQATRVIDRPDHVVRIDCPRCGRKVPVLPDTEVQPRSGFPGGVTECRTCRGDGSEEGERMYGDAAWWASQVAPEGQPVTVDALPLVMPRYGYDGLELERLRKWVFRYSTGDNPEIRVSWEKRGGGRLVRVVDPKEVAAVAARMQARSRRVRAGAR